MNYMNYKKIVLLSSILMLSGCVGLPLLVLNQQQDVVNTTYTQSYNDKNQARLRIYYKFANINMYENNSCDEWKSKKVKNYFQSLATSLPNTEIVSIGMPYTEDSSSILNVPQKGWGPKSTFKEYLLDANKPLVLDARRVETTGGYSCQIASSFIPEAGRDYEAWYSGDNTSCSIQLREITKEKVNTLYQTQKLNKLQMCR